MKIITEGGAKSTVEFKSAEISAEGTSLYQYDPKGKASSAYLALVNDILGKECN